MFSRWYSLFLGYLLIVFGVAGLIAASQVNDGRGGLVTASIIWLIIAIAALWVGYGVRNDRSVRAFAGILGGILFLWGAIQLLSSPSADSTSLLAATASIGGLMVLLGSLGLAAASLPITTVEGTSKPSAA